MSHGPEFGHRPRQHSRLRYTSRIANASLAIIRNGAALDDVPDARPGGGAQYRARVDFRVAVLGGTLCLKLGRWDWRVATQGGRIPGGPGGSIDL